MYITINNIKGEKRIDLFYSIQNFDSNKEIAVIRMLSDNVKYEILKLRSVMVPISDAKKMIPKGAYASRELISMLEGIVELNQFEDQVTKTNKGRTIIFLSGGGYHFWELQTIFFQRVMCFKQFFSSHFVMKTIFYDHF